MDRKYKLLVASSLVAIMATGCSSYGSRGNTDPQTSVTGGYAGGQQQVPSGTQQGATLAVVNNEHLQVVVAHSLYKTHALSVLLIIRLL